MKHIPGLLLAAAVLLGGCVYEAPLETKHIIAIDPAVLGVWEPAAKDDEKAQRDERMVILKYSDTEYLVHYPPGGNDEAYYRGYPVKIGDVACVQLQIIGTAGGPPGKDMRKLFHVVSYQLKDGRLEIKTLNTDLVDDGLKTTNELSKAFLKHTGGKDLFRDPAVFKKIKP